MKGYSYCRITSSCDLLKKYCSVSVGCLMTGTAEFWSGGFSHIYTYVPHVFNKIYAERTKSKVVVAQFSGFFHGANSRVVQKSSKFSVALPLSKEVQYIHTTHLSLKVSNSTLPCWYLLWSQRISKRNFRLLIKNHQGSIHFWWPRHLRKSLGFWDWMGEWTNQGFCRSV